MSEVHSYDLVTWRCTVDGADWPCVPAKRQLREQHAHDDLHTYMSWCARRAARDLGVHSGAELGALYDRMVTWTAL